MSFLSNSCKNVSKQLKSLDYLDEAYLRYKEFTSVFDSLQAFEKQIVSDNLDGFKELSKGFDLFHIQLRFNLISDKFMAFFRYSHFFTEMDFFFKFRQKFFLIPEKLRSVG